MKYNERKQIAESYLPRVVEGMSFQELEHALKEEVKYERDVIEIIRAVKRLLEVEYLDMVEPRDELEAVSTPMFADDVSAYLRARGRATNRQRRDDHVDRLLKDGASAPEITARLADGDVTEAEVQARIAARRQRETEEGENDFFSFQGRIGRKTFGQRLVLAMIVAYSTFRILAALRVGDVLTLALAFLVGIPLFIFLLSQMVRRLRDLELPNWLILMVILLSLVRPASIGLVIILAMLIIKQLPADLKLPK